MSQRNMIEGTLVLSNTDLIKDEIYNNCRNIHRVWNYGKDKGLNYGFLIDNNIKYVFMHSWDSLIKDHEEVISNIEFKKEYSIKDFISILFQIGHISKQEVNNYNKQRRDTIIKTITDYQTDKVVYAETLFASIMEFLYVQGKPVTRCDLLNKNQLYQGLLLMAVRRNKLIDSELINITSSINEDQEENIKYVISSFNINYSFYVRDEYKHESDKYKLIQNGEVEKLIRDRFNIKRVEHTDETMYDYLTTTGVIKEEYKDKTASQLDNEDLEALEHIIKEMYDKYGKYLIDKSRRPGNLVDELLSDAWFDSKINNRPNSDQLYDVIVDFDRPSAEDKDEERFRLIEKGYSGMSPSDLKESCENNQK